MGIFYGDRALSTISVIGKTTKVKFEIFFSPRMGGVGQAGEQSTKEEQYTLHPEWGGGVNADSPNYEKWGAVCFLGFVASFRID